MTNPDIISVFNQFNTSGTLLDGFPTGSGHIHSTYLVRTSEESEPDYIIQKINHNVFPPVAEMMNNIQKVTSHIKKKREAFGDAEVLEIIETKSKRNYYTDPGGNHWRMYKKIRDGKSYDVIPGKKVAFEAGKAFGQFLADLGDMPADEIFPVIPEFHSIEMRYGKFIHSVKDNPCGRISEVKEEMDFVNNHINRMLIIPRLEKEGKLPLRITHNDTKLNNVLFDKSDRAICVIDLDTVMPGLALYDFGDTIRTAANTALEDEADLDKIQFNIKVFKAFAEGFLEKTFYFLNPFEVKYLALASQYMTFIMGLRFLTDYISGDIYYHINYSKQNYQRCRTQFRLMQCMIVNYQESQEIIMQTAEKYKKR